MKNIKMEEEIEKKIKYLKEFIKEKTDIGTANYVGEELRKLCGMVETEALSQHDVIKNEVAVCGNDCNGVPKYCEKCYEIESQFRQCY